MTKIDIISGFLGAGKTTLIKKLIEQAFKGEKLVLIENEFGEIGIDGGFLKDAGVQITEMNSGCICCSLVGDFGTALKQVITDYTPDRIIIEPSGVGKLSDVIKAVKDVSGDLDVELDSYTTVADVSKVKIYMKNFGEFFNNQVEHASAILLSRTQNMDQAKLNVAAGLLRNKNPKAAILTTPWEQLTGDQIVSAMEGGRSLAEELMEEIGHSHGGDEEHHHHHHEHGESCSCGHDHHNHDHHDHDHHDHEHHDEHEHCHDEAACDVCLGHEHHHDHDEAACDACCGHHHHHGHDADEVFTSWGRETPRKYSREDLQDALSALAMSEDYGYILRAKGMVPCDDGQTWLHFDLVPEEFQIREGAADYTGRLCVIGSGLDEAGLEKLFQLV